MASHQSFKKAAGLMLVAVIASRLLGFIREMLIARQFGQTGPVSAYYAAFNVPDLLYFFLSSGALSAAFIPVFTERFNTGRQKEAWEVFSIIACFMGIILTAAIVICWIFAKPLVSVLAVPGFVTQHPELVPLTMLLTRIVLPCQLFFFLGGLMMATLQSRQEFRATAAAPVIYNAGIIFGAVILSHWLNIKGLAFGAMIGALVGNIIYVFYWMKRQGFEFHPSLNIRHPGVVRVASLALPVVLGLGLPQIDVIINRWFASYVSESAPAALNFANRLMQLPLGIFAQAAGTAILPMLAAYAAKNALDDMRSGLGEGLRSIMVESIPATVFMVLMADPLVRTLYMSGEFKPSNVPATVIPLIFYAIGIFAWAGQAIVARGFFALQDTKTPVVTGTVATVIFIPTNFILMKTMGTGGIALATTIAISLHFFALTWFLRKRLNGIEGTKLVRTVGRVLLASAALGVICIGIRLGMSRAIGSWQLQDGDVTSSVQLGAELHHSKAPSSSYLYDKLTTETRGMVSASEEVSRLDPMLRKSLVSDLNQLIRKDSLYDEKRFSKVTLSAATTRLAQESASGNALMRLNRGLLDAAFADSIVGATNESFVDKLLGMDKKRVTHGPKWEFTSSDFRDLQLFVAKVRDKQNLVSGYLMSQLSASTKALLADYAAKYDASKDLPNSLMHDLNVAITSDSIYNPSRFASVHNLPHRLVSTAQSHPTGKRLAEVNRRLLEAAYPELIVKRSETRVESRMGSLLTVLLAMGLSGAVYFALLRLLKVNELDYLWSALRRKFFKRPGGGGGTPTPEPVVQAEPME
ncbi:MAG: murein biosynthesis integral membrane protein MurJ [Armatimonadota bacterium]|nr:murein biosynthesis integral membrane protein MurJ [bacterium]